MKAARLKQLLAKSYGRVVGIAQEGVLDNNASLTACLEYFDKVLQEQRRGLSSLDGEILLYLGTLLAAERGVGEDDIVAVLLLNIS
jgi:hypothetical protein